MSGRHANWTRRQAVELGFTVLLLAGAIYYISESLRLPPANNSVIGPSVFPLAIGGFMVLIALRLIYVQLRPLWSRDTPAAALDPEIDEVVVVPDEDDDTSVSSWPDVVLVILSLFALVLVFTPFGFIESLTLFVFGLATVFDRRRWRINLIVAVGVSVLFYLLFTHVLQIGLPPGLVGKLL